MNGTEKAFLKNQFDAFVDASTARLGKSGGRTYVYGIDMSDFKAATGRQRVHSGLVEEAVDYFRGMGAEASYESTTDSFDVVVNLDSCKLNAGQANRFVTAQDYYFSQGGE